ncbi:hypothetical protein PHMEG_0009314 [Phytophthora megakarya]|uniref:Uncharacterized protein n=1 Tax=Phytophthora megakarya TaxID=4795 RepID=A0A225WGH7_9STRA|nr:hypothetical protein PHMEG_0009314 [Phytophthora megakarya]
MTDAKMLLLGQDGIGQIVGHRLTRSENKEETAALLRWIKPALDLENLGDDSVYVVSDNATAVKTLVNDVFDKRVSVKQDPFHGIQRISEKLKSPRKKQVCKTLKDVMYTVDRKLRPPEEMAAIFRILFGCRIFVAWRGYCESNIRQIELKDIYVDENTYSKGGRHFNTISRLELSLNETQSSGPQAALLCRYTMPASSQLAFVLHILSEPLDEPQYRSASSIDFSFSQWQRLFEPALVDPDSIDAALTAPKQHFQNVKELLLKSARSVVANHLPKHAFLASLNLDVKDYEPSADFTSQGYELLRQIRAEQEDASCAWPKCPLVTTITYNLIVANNPNTALQLHRRSYRTLKSKISALSTKQFDSKRNLNVPVNLFALHQERPVTLGQLFEALRSSTLFKSKNKLFSQVYDFASRSQALQQPSFRAQN